MPLPIPPTARSSGVPAGPLSALVYRSMAVQPLDAEALKALVDQARSRNHALSITGVLLYHQGVFFQWLEGPRPALDVVWGAIQRDARHQRLELLGDRAVPQRLFGGWDMRLFRAGSAGQPVPTSFDAMLLRVKKDGAPPIKPIEEPAPHLNAGVLDGQAVAKLARLSLRADDEAAWNFVDELRWHGTEALFVDLIEPAQRCLGDWWCDDLCTEIELTVALCRLQMAVRRLSTLVPPQPRAHPTHQWRVMLTPLPAEPHMLGTVIASEFFWRAGWEVQCEFPASVPALQDLVRTQALDAVQLSLSGCFRREERMGRMRDAITGLRAASRNPRLVVLAGGRLFSERPEMAAEVGADMSATCPRGTVGRLEALLTQRL